MNKQIFIFLLLIAVFLFSCQEDKKSIPVPPPATVNVQQPVIPTPDFNADSAYQFIKEQVDFGPRVPSTKAHKNCADYLEKKIKTYQWELLVQEGEVATYNNKKIAIKNIMGRYLPENTNRILLFAHWDTRPYADRDTKNQSQPIDGANDGGSGVAVLLELVRQINNSEHKPTVGIDILFVDAEDYGKPESTMFSNKSDTWCLGSQYWAKHIPIPNYHPQYGILLDMVGAKDAVFPKEGTSMYYAPSVVHKIWSVAARLGYSNYFINQETPGGLTDDHLYINSIANIPSIDIIHYIPQQHDFGSFHHTHQDNMDIIDKNTLKAVGQTLLEVIYTAK